MDALRQLSGLAARPFSSQRETTEAVLGLAHRVLGLRTPFVARTSDGEFRVIAAESHDGCSLEPGATLPLEESY